MSKIYLIQNEFTGRDNFLEIVSNLTLIPISKLEEIVDMDQLVISSHYVQNIVRNIDNISSVQELLDNIDLLEKKYKIAIFEHKVI